VLLAEEKEISLEFEGIGAVMVSGNAMRLKQVIVNLVDNAIKYTPKGGAVRVSVSASEDTALLSVSDTGIGIPSTAIPLIFERFYRADEVRSRTSGGIGLGLAIVKSICTAHHGVISATSVEGEGSKFRMELPLISVPNAVFDQQVLTPLSHRKAPSGQSQAESSERVTNIVR
ncbi:MAG TPA: ATP-binding protein, partial [Candidatus Elarobacter sp.]|nr:ATP-binding protein [Candidatus Elarobacter sp.]